MEVIKIAFIRKQPISTNIKTQTKTPAGAQPKPRGRALAIIRGPMRKATLLLIMLMVISAAALAVTYWSDTIFISQTVTEGAAATKKDIALPMGFVDTAQNTTILRVMNVTTAADNVDLILSISSGTQVTLASSYSLFRIEVYYSTSSLAFNWNLLTDLTATERIAAPGDYTFNYKVFYTPSTTGTLGISIDADLVRT